MLGTTWVNQRGERAALRAEDFMVVAPYNDQVDLLREAFDRTAGLRDVQVGTVDKFQGREAPVVFFTMTTSSGEDMPRGPEFLFSRNRLNVAVSRARCLAYLVCTEAVAQLARAHDRRDAPHRDVERVRRVRERRLTSGQCVGSHRRRRRHRDVTEAVDSATLVIPSQRPRPVVICNSADGADKVGIPVAGLFGRGINGEIPRWCTSHR